MVGGHELFHLIDKIEMCLALNFYVSVFAHSIRAYQFNCVRMISCCLRLALSQRGFEDTGKSPQPFSYKHTMVNSKIHFQIVQVTITVV